MESSIGARSGSAGRREAGFGDCGSSDRRPIGSHRRTGVPAASIQACRRGAMADSRREFLAGSSLGLIGAAMAAGAEAQDTPGAPPAFGTSPAVGPAVSAATFSQAEKLVQIEMTAKDLAQAAENWQESLAGVYERRTGPKKLAIEDTIAPATTWNPMLPGTASGPAKDFFVASSQPAPRLPARDEDIAFAPVAHLSEWITTRQISSERLTEIYLQRLETYDRKLHCVITLTREHALKEAQAADRSEEHTSELQSLRHIV